MRSSEDLIHAVQSVWAFLASVDQHRNTMRHSTQTEQTSKKGYKERKMCTIGLRYRKKNATMHLLGWHGKFCETRHLVTALSCSCLHMHVLNTAGNSCCLRLMTHLAHNILSAQQSLETAPSPSLCPTLPHPNSRSWGRSCNRPIASSKHPVLISHPSLQTRLKPPYSAIPTPPSPTAPT